MVEPHIRRHRRSRWLTTALPLAVVGVILLLVVLVGPWAGHLGLPWLGHGALPAVRIAGADGAWHNGPVDLRFVNAEGELVSADYRIDGGAWKRGRRTRIRAPETHADDGVHTVSARLAGSTGPFTTAQVRIDTTQPVVRDLTVQPRHITGAAKLSLSFDAPAQPGITVQWAVVTTLGHSVGASGARQSAAGVQHLSWDARTSSGELLFPGTYRLRVTAVDAAGNRTVAQESFASARPVPAKLYLHLPQAGDLVALTFDGGSGYAWRHIMLQLASVHAHGTFFCTGQSLAAYPEVAREAVALGMTLGNHSYDHPDFRTISYAQAVAELEKNAQEWWQACQASPSPFFRPPYGFYDAKTLKAAGQAGFPFVVNWDVDTHDWLGASPKVIAQRAIAGAKPGSIICMHTQWNTEAAVPAIVKGLRAKGLEPVGLDELFHAAGLM
jgi:peptidoglycan/xylan/chitin deacetylase (PgdA/CDA1 family)